MILSKLSIQKPILMSMIIAAFVVFGLVAFFKLPIDLTPNIEFPYVTVQAIYMGAGPDEIENSVVKPIEEQLSTVPNVKNITSLCGEGVGFLFIEFNIGTNPDLAAIDVKDKVDAILYKLPREMLKPVISKFDINARPIINLAVIGPQSPERLRDISEKKVKERLAKIPGVASISVSGGREKEIQVNIYKEKMDALNLSIPMIAGILAAQTANVPAGHVSGDFTEYTVRVQGQFESLDEIASIRVPVYKSGEERGGMAWIPLSSIADIVDTYKEVRESARFNRQNTVGLGIIKRSDANTVGVAKKIRSVIKEIQQDLPVGTNVIIARDSAEFIEIQVQDMYRNILIGIVLTALMLLVFLGDWRLAVIAAITIPGSVIITFLGMQIFGFTINVITLISIGISIGTLVTNAIIVLENISRHRNEGMDIRSAAEYGTNEVVVAVLASALTNVAVFVPLANMKGITGQFFKPLGITITVATLASLMLSFTLAPMMASRMLQSARRDREGANIDTESLADRLLKPLKNGYIRLLRWALHRKALVIVVVAFAFLGTIFGLARMLGSEFFPQMDMGFINVDLEMPSGSSIAATDFTLAEIEKRLQNIAEVKDIYSSIGGSGTMSGVNYANVLITLKDKKFREKNSIQVANEIRPLLSDLPDAKIVVKAAGMFGRGSEADIQVEITGENMADILSVADTIRNKAIQIPGLADVSLSWKAAKPEIKFIPNRLRLDEYGIQVATLGFALRTALSGYEAAVLRDEDNEYTIRVQLSENDRNTIDAIEAVSIPTQKGMVPIKALTEVRYEGGAANIERKNRQRLVYVNANVVKGTSGVKAAELKKEIDKIALPPGCRANLGGQQEMMQESFSELGTAAVLAIIITYMVLAASVESFLLPLLIMLTLPLGLIGVIWALLITGNSISMISLMSLIMLIGVVVNNAILLVDYANIKRKKGVKVFEAIVEACKVKFVPIIMMNFAIVISAIPQALAVGTFSSPFAITAIGGVVVSAIMTFFVIPVFYLVAIREKR